MSLPMYRYLMTVFALVAGLAQLVFPLQFHLQHVLLVKKDLKHPWKSNTLEWTAPQEHMHGNWPGAIPHVHRWAYDYSKTDKNGEYVIPGQDFVPQHIPMQDDEEELHH